MNKIALTVIEKNEKKTLALWNVDDFQIFQNHIRVVSGGDITTYEGELIGGFAQSADHTNNCEYL